MIYNYDFDYHILMPEFGCLNNSIIHELNLLIGSPDKLGINYIISMNNIDAASDRDSRAVTFMTMSIVLILWFYLWPMNKL